MYDIPELEKKWRKYRRNRIKKPIIISILSLSIIGVAGYFGSKYMNGSLAVTQPESKHVVKKEVVEKNSNTNQEPAIVITKTPANPNTQQNSINNQPLNNTSVNSKNDDNTIDLSNATIVKPNVPDDEIRVIGFDKNEQKNIKKKYQDILVPKQTEADLREKEEIAVYEERFKTSQDPQDSLYLAKYYYKKGNYEKAETWAVNTNSIDGDIEDSWIIFAKARAKQGHRVDAIKVLQSYYDETQSKNAKKILDKLRHNIPIK